MRTDVTLAELAAEQRGLVVAGPAAARGIGPDQLYRRRAGGLLVPVHAGIDRHLSTPEHLDQRLLAASLAAGGRGPISHRSAARLWELTDRFEDVVELALPERGHLRLRGVVVHRSTDLRPHHVTNRRGLPVTTVERTLVDLGAVTTAYIVRSCVDRALSDERTTRARLESIVAELGRRGRRGIGALRWALEHSLPGDERPDSPLEAAMDRLIARYRLPPGVAHYRIVDASGGFVAEVDRAWPEVEVAAEVDGFSVHGTRAAFEHDLARENRIVALGWTLLRFTKRDIVDRSAAVAAQLDRALTRNGFLSRNSAPRAARRDKNDMRGRGRGRW